MERDFLGLRRDCVQDEAFLGSAVQWPFSNKSTAMQQYMSYKAAQDERQKHFSLDQLTSAGFHAMSSFETSQRTPVPASLQKYDRQGIHQFPVQPYHSQGVDNLINSSLHLKDNRTFPVVSHHSVPMTTSSPFFQVHGSNPNVRASSLNQPPFGRNTSPSGAFPTRNMPKRSPISAQLTIFYAGTVNVYDDVPFEKAQAIMLLASKGANTGSNAPKQRSEVPLPASVPIPMVQTSVSSATISAPMVQATAQGSILQGTVPVMTKLPGTNGLSSKISIPSPPMPCSLASSPILGTSRLGANSGTVCSTMDDMSRPKLGGPTTSGSPQETSRNSGSGSGSTIEPMPRAIPQARKATLARFLEKRKERITNVMPYSCSKKIAESGFQFDGTNAMKISSAMNVSIPSKILELECLGQSKAGLTSAEPLSTRLQM